jgi:dihydroorotate dehydrogenase electron transfer subunit
MAPADQEKTPSMSNPLHAKYYADSAVQRRVELIDQVRLARDTYRLRFACPEIAARITPGQFLMVRLADRNDPLIGRPLALYDTVLDAAGRPDAVDLVYLVKGKFTSRLAECPISTALDVWGPLGNGFLPRDARQLIMVAGGIGQTPFVALARECLGLRRYGTPARRPATTGRVTLCYGARSADWLAGVDDFRSLGVDVQLATDDGSLGHRGLVTDLLERLLAERPAGCRIACCGPDAMMQAVARIAARTNTPCDVSLETPMACGIGICFTCVARVRDATGQWDYKRTCVEGPVFDAALIQW